MPFPKAGIDFIQHDLRVRLCNKKRDFDETVTLTGAMTIQRGDPYAGKNTCRIIDFKVISWVASGWIEKMGVALSYVAVEGEDQPVSTIEAEQPDSDFPATFNFDVLFDVRINNELVFRRLHGRPKGRHFRQVPPTGNRRLTPTITEFVDLNQVRIDHPQFGPITATPIDCNDQSGKTVLKLPRGTPLFRPLGIRME